MASPKTVDRREAEASRLKEQGYVPVGRYKGQILYGKPLLCSVCNRGFAARDGKGPAVSIGGVLFHRHCIGQ